MGALGHFLEEEGVPTTQISLVREHTAAMEAEQWFWRESVVGQVFLKLREACLSSEDKALRHFGARNVVPMAISARLDGVR